MLCTLRRSLRHSSSRLRPITCAARLSSRCATGGGGVGGGGGGGAGDGRRSTLSPWGVNQQRLFHSSRSSYVSLRADPEVCLHDVHTTLSLDDLPPATHVTLRAETYNDNGKQVLNPITPTVSSGGTYE